MNVILVYLTITIWGINAVENESLIHVHAIFRHGDRAPIYLLSNGNNITKNWPNGLGELTNIGINQHFELGQWLRKRYDGYLNTKYNLSEIYVRSTDVDRTLMSAESNLAGLYFNKKNIVIPDLKWRPIPIHTIPQKSDIIMLQDDCNKYKILKKEIYKSKTFLPLLKRYQRTLDLVRNYTNKPKMDFIDLWEVYDILFCEKNHNITWVKWVTDEIYYNLTQLHILDWQIMYYNEELQRLSGGLFLHEIIKQLKNATLTPSENRKEKLRIYSGHDTDVAALMSAIGVYEELQPPYASCFLIELWAKGNSRNSLGNVYIKMYLKNNTEQKSIDLPEIILKQCPQHPCLLSEFIEVVRPRTMTKKQYKDECLSSRFTIIIFSILMIGIFTLLTVSLMIYFLIERCRKI